MSKYTRKSPLGFAILVTEERAVLMGFPKALTTDRFWESGEEFAQYLEEHGVGLDLKVERRSTPIGFYVMGEESELEKMLDAMEDHFFLDGEDEYI